MEKRPLVFKKHKREKKSAHGVFSFLCAGVNLHELKMVEGDDEPATTELLHNRLDSDYESTILSVLILEQTLYKTDNGQLADVRCFILFSIS